jgi:sugar phosphate permease
MGDNDSNNIAKFIKKIVQNHIEENKTYNFSKIEHIFYTYILHNKNIFVTYLMKALLNSL